MLDAGMLLLWLDGSQFVFLKFFFVFLVHGLTNKLQG